MLKHTLSILAVLALSGCVGPMEQDESFDDDENMGSTEEAAVSTTCNVANMTAAAKKARTAINNIRAKAGMPAMYCDKNIQQATKNHAHYLTVHPPNGESPHLEDPKNTPEYTGVSFGARMKAAGFVGQPSTEDISGDVGGNTTVQDLMDSVYHRAPFVSFWGKRWGFAAEGGWAVIDFGNPNPGDKPSPELRATWPVNLATGVKTSFNCASEDPNPCPQGKKSSKVGYPISLSAGSTLSDLTTTLTKKTNNGNVKVPHFKVMYASDSQVYMMANDELELGTTYTATVAGNYTVTENKVTTKIPFVHKWSFTTKN